MPRNPNDIAKEWMQVAESDLIAARALLGNPVLPRQTSYCAQQCAEKAIKAILSQANIAFPKTHDLVELVTLLPPQSAIHTLKIDWATLTEWAVRGRYPGTGPAAMNIEASDAIVMAAKIFAVAQSQIP